MQARAWRNHGLTRPQFLELTPTELLQLDEDLREEITAEHELADRRTARLVAAIYNASPRSRRSDFSEDDFLPRRRDAAPSAADLLAKVHNIHALFGGN